MERRTKIAVLGTVTAVIIIAIVAITMIIDKITPSDKVMELTEYYKLGDSEVLVILQDEIYETKGMLQNGKIYIDYDTVIQQFNHRFYWDNNENLLTYTTPDEIIRTEADSKEYTVTKSMIETKVVSDYPIVEFINNQVYLSLDFVKQYSDLTFEYYEEPNRVVINYIWGDYLYSKVSEATQLRYKPSIKSPILVQLPAGTSLMHVDTEEAPEKGFVKVMTADGIKGYVRQKNLKKSFYEKLESSYQAPKCTAQTRTGKVNMVFHQIFNESAVDNLENLVRRTKDLTVIAPTFFSIKDEAGTLSSVATQEYVSKAEDLGLEVWAVVDDFNVNPDLNMSQLLSYSSRRDALSNALIEAALEYKLNGINIDFEKIPSESGIHFIEFLRELSVKCRNNGIVLSVDNYVPSPYTEYYDREEQGEILDYVVIMAYDEYHGGSEVAGPVSSIGFVKDAINNTLAMVPKEKTIIAIPFYTRVWKEVNGEVSAEALGMARTIEFLAENGVEAKWDNSYGCNYAEFTKDGAIYRIWQEEERSIEEKMKAIKEADVAGVAEWKLGLENENVWNTITRYIK